MPSGLVPAYLAEVSAAFLDGLQVACLVTGGVALVGSVLAAVFLPARAAAEQTTVDQVAEMV